MNTLLGDVRVIDLCEGSTGECAKILGDMGADVIKVEKPCGDPARNIGPFYGGIPHREKSLFWFAYNNNKRGITLDIEMVEGQQILKRLVENADIVVESFHPGYMEELGLGYEALKEINPKTIMTSITPFGQTGPYRDYKAPDMVVWALGSLMVVCGDPDRPPVQVSVPQSYLAAATYAAEGTMVAYYERGISGLGQHIDVSAQAAVAWCNSEQPPHWIFLGVESKRGGESGVVRPRPDSTQPVRRARALWECKGGWVNYGIMVGMAGAERNIAMTKWLEEEGLATEYYRRIDWPQVDMRKLTDEDLEQIMAPIRRLFQAYTPNELFDEAVRRGIPVFPVASPKDVMESTQLEAREFWTPVHHDELDTAIVYPGPFTLMSETPIAVRQRAPLLGEHNQEVYMEELGFTLEQLTSLQGIGAI